MTYKTRFFYLGALFLIGSCLPAQQLKVSENNRFLVTESDEPFFWLADTAWELFHRCDRKEADMYPEKRAEQGFIPVLQAVALAEIDSLIVPNPYGETSLLNNDPSTPNDAYFKHVDYIIKKDGDLGIYIDLPPTLGDKLNTKNWGKGPEVLTPENAEQFGKWIGNRYKNYDNIAWIIGGDRNPRDDSNDVLVWRQMDKGVADAVGGNDMALMSFHPQPKEEGGSSTWLHQDEWLDFNMNQTGHCPDKETYEHIIYDYNLSSTKPMLDGEPLYKDHPNCFNAKEQRHSVPSDIRRIMHWNVFAWAFGQTYGCHAVWQMYKLDKKPINRPLRPSQEAMELPLATEAKLLKNLTLSRPFLTRIPDQSMVLVSHEEYQEYVIATRDSEGSYAMVYVPTGKITNLIISSLKTISLDTWWCDPRTGNSFKGEALNRFNKVSITPPTPGKGNDWVLVVDARNNNFKAFGL